MSQKPSWYHEVMDIDQLLEVKENTVPKSFDEYLSDLFGSVPSDFSKVPRWMLERARELTNYGKIQKDFGFVCEGISGIIPATRIQHHEMEIFAKRLWPSVFRNQEDFANKGVRIQKQKLICTSKVAKDPILNSYTGAIDSHWIYRFTDGFFNWFCYTGGQLDKVSPGEQSIMSFTLNNRYYRPDSTVVNYIKRPKLFTETQATD